MAMLQPGDTFGDYTVVKLLGKGGMGAVYLLPSGWTDDFAAARNFELVMIDSPKLRGFADEPFEEDAATVERPAEKSKGN